MAKRLEDDAAMVTQLNQQVAQLNLDNARLDKMLDEERDSRHAAERSLKESREHFADLKIRLAAAETANQFMRGYLARVQEDDVVREELVQTGDPHGEQHLAPKRKATSFPRPEDFTYPSYNEGFGSVRTSEERRRLAKHWVNY